MKFFKATDKIRIIHMQLVRFTRASPGAKTSMHWKSKSVSACGDLKRTSGRTKRVAGSSGASWMKMSLGTAMAKSRQPTRVTKSNGKSYTFGTTVAAQVHVKCHHLSAILYALLYTNTVLYIYTVIIYLLRVEPDQKTLLVQVPSVFASILIKWPPQGHGRWDSTAAGRDATTSHCTSDRQEAAMFSQLLWSSVMRYKDGIKAR